MRICNLGSGSKGNCTYIESASGHKILIDAGLSFLEISKRLNMAGAYITDIEAIFISHEHSDHIKALDTFVSKTNAKIYVHADGKVALMSKCKKISEENITMFFDNDFDFFTLKITPISLSHDSSHCTGYKICEDGTAFAILTDLGKTTDLIEDAVSDCSLLFLEANHNIKMLLANDKYSPVLKRRILSSHGHLNNEDCAKAISRIIKKGVLRQVVLSHLSEENNTPQVAYNDVCSTLKEFGIIEGVNLKIDVANQQIPTPIFKLNKK